MKKSTTLALTLLLTACLDHESPLKKMDEATVSGFIWEHRTAETDQCYQHFAAPEQASKDALQACAPVKETLARQMKEEKFADAKANDLDEARFWQHYASRKANTVPQAGEVGHQEMKAQEKAHDDAAQRCQHLKARMKEYFTCMDTNK